MALDILGIINGVLGLASLPGLFQNNERANELFDDILGQRDLARQDPNLPALINQELQRRSNFLNGQGPLSGTVGLAQSQVANALTGGTQAANSTIQGLQALSGLSGPGVRGLSSGGGRGDGPSGGGDSRGSLRPTPPPVSLGAPSAFGAGSMPEMQLPDLSQLLNQEQLPQANFFTDPNAQRGPFDFLAHTPQTGNIVPFPGQGGGNGGGNGGGGARNPNDQPLRPTLPNSPTDILDPFGSPGTIIPHTNTGPSNVDPNYVPSAPGPRPPNVPQNPGRSPWNVVDPRNPYDIPIGRSPRTAGMPSYQQGTGFVPQTGPANLHRGEMVVPANQNPNNANRFTSMPPAPGAPQPTGVRHPNMPQITPPRPPSPTPIPRPPGQPYVTDLPQGSPVPQRAPQPNGDVMKGGPVVPQLPPPQPNGGTMTGGGLMQNAPTPQLPPPPQTFQQPLDGGTMTGGGLRSQPQPQQPTNPFTSTPIAQTGGGLMSGTPQQSPQQTPVTSGQPYLTNSLEALQRLINSGGPINQDVQNIQNQQVNDLSANQQLQNQRALRENLGARGLGDSGAQDFLELQNRLGAQGNQIQGQNQVALNAANTNFNAMLGAGQALNTGALGAETLGLQRDQLAQALNIANRGFDLQGRGLDIQQMLGQGGLANQSRGLDIQQQLGLGGQELQRYLGELGNQTTLRGQDLSQILGQRGLDIEQMLGQGRLGLDSLLGQGRLSLDTELGRRGQDIQETSVLGNLGLGQGQLDLQRYLGDRGLDIDYLRALTGRELGFGDLNLRQDALGNDIFQQNRDFERQLGLDQFGITSAQNQQAMDFISQLFGLQAGQEQLSQDQLAQLLSMIEQAFPSGNVGGGGFAPPTGETAPTGRANGPGDRRIDLRNRQRVA